MKYMLMFYENEDAFAQRQDAARAPHYWGAWGSYVQSIEESGVVVDGAGLQPPNAGTSVRIVKGERMVQDGPVALTKEQLGGYFVIDVPNLDEAMNWAARSPSAAWGVTEIRPVMPPPSR